MARKGETAAAPAPAAPKPRCTDCTNDATMALIVNKRKVPICTPCATARQTAEAKARCAEMGIHNAADARKWLGSNQLLVRRRAG